MSVPLSTVLIAPCTLALRPDPATVPVNAIVSITDQGNKQYQNVGGVWTQYSPTPVGADPSATVAPLDGDETAGVASEYSRGDHQHAQEMRNADPVTPADGTWWVVDDGVSLDIRARKSGVTYTLVSLTLP